MADYAPAAHPNPPGSVLKTHLSPGQIKAEYVDDVLEVFVHDVPCVGLVEVDEREEEVRIDRDHLLLLLSAIFAVFSPLVLLPIALLPVFILRLAIRRLQSILRVLFILSKHTIISLPNPL